MWEAHDPNSEQYALVEAYQSRLRLMLNMVTTQRLLRALVAERR